MAIKKKRIRLCASTVCKRPCRSSELVRNSCQRGDTLLTHVRSGHPSASCRVDVAGTPSVARRGVQSIVFRTESIPIKMYAEKKYSQLAIFRMFIVLPKTSVANVIVVNTMVFSVVWRLNQYVQIRLSGRDETRIIYRRKKTIPLVVERLKNIHFFFASKTIYR